ncbi:hypothetical protein BT69DRAFT_1125893 [Atractiella rhizophila]|nr:hypothetical protein BT69DRAFT_1125893 [Atractiella rhizophila]
MAALVRVHKTKRARKLFDSITRYKIRPTTPQPYVTLATSYALEGNIEEVERVLDQARSDPNISTENAEADFLSVLHNAHLSARDPIRAQEIVRSALEQGLRPNFRLMRSLPNGAADIRTLLHRASFYGPPKKRVEFDLPREVVDRAALLAKDNQRIIKAKLEEEEAIFSKDIKRMLRFLEDLRLPANDPLVRERAREQAVEEITRWLEEVTPQFTRNREGSLY